MLIHAIVHWGGVGVGLGGVAGVWGVRTHVKKSALKVDSWRKISCHTGESNLRQQRAGPMFFQLIFTPTLYYIVRSIACVRVCVCCVCADDHFLTDAVVFLS